MKVWRAWLAAFLFLAAASALPLRGEVVELEWDPNSESDLTGYHVYRSTTSGAGYQRLTSSPVSSAFYADSGAEAGSDYFYVVTAVNSGGLESGYSNELHVQTPAPLPNLPPSAAADALEVDEDTAGLVDVLANDSDPDGDSLSVAGFDQGVHGSVALHSSGGLTYTPSPDYYGQDSFSYTVQDGHGGQAAAVVTVNVRPVNDAPLAQADSAATDEDSAVSIDVLANDSDVEGQALQLVSAGQAANGAVELIGQSVRYTPVQDFFGQDSFSYTVEDASGAAGQGHVSVNVLPVNDPPLAEAGENQSVRYKSLVLLAGTASDPDGDELTVEWRQLSGPPVDLANADQLTASFTAPKLRRDEQMVFELSVSDGVESAGDQVTISGNGSRQLFFPVEPKLSLAGDLFVGGVIFNPSSEEEAVEWTARDSSGAEISRMDGDVLQPRGLDAFVAGELEEGLGSSDALIAQGLEGELQGFFMVGDEALHGLDGVGSQLEESDRLYFPVVAHGGDDYTSITLFNPDPSLQAQIDLRLLAGDGALLQVTRLTLSSLGFVSAGLEELFGEISLQDGMLVAESSIAVQGFQVLRRHQNLSALPGLSAAPVSKLLAPHFFSGAEGDSQIRLHNAGTRPVMADIQAYDSSRNPLGRKGVWIQPASLLATGLRPLFGWQGPQERSGYLEIDLLSASLGKAEVIGSLTFSGNQERTLASLPLLREARSEQIFLHVAQSTREGLFTGLALLNPEGSTAQVTVEAFDENGIRTAQAQLRLEAGDRFVELLNGESLFGPSFEQLRGHFLVRSSVPLAAFALFGDYQGEFLAAIESQIPLASEEE